MRTIRFFHATWCKPCGFLMRNIIPVIQEACPDQVELVDVMEQPSFAEKQGVIRIPVIHLIDDGEIVRKVRMVVYPDRLIDWLKGGEMYDSY